MGATVVSFNLGRIRQRFSLRIVLVVSCVLIAGAAIGIGAAGTIAVVIVAALVYGLGDGAAVPALQDLGTVVSGDEQRGAITAAWVSAARLGQTAGSLAAGPLFAATTTGTTMVLGGVLFATVAVIAAVAPLVDD